MLVVHFCDLDRVEDIGLFTVLIMTVIDETAPYFKGHLYTFFTEVSILLRLEGSS